MGKTPKSERAREERGATSIFHDPQEGDDDGGNGLEGGGGLPPPLRVHYRAERIVQNPSAHLSLSPPPTTTSTGGEQIRTQLTHRKPPIETRVLVDANSLDRFNSSRFSS